LKLLRLKIENMLSYADTDLDLSGLGLTSVLGRNGHGKSAIFGSVAYALYGKYLVTSDKHLIRDDQDKMRVELEFEFGDHVLRVVRGYGKKGFAYLWVDDQKVAEGTRNVNEAVIDIIKMNFEVFIATTFFIQGGLDTFSSAAPADRKKYLSNILDLGGWTKWHNQVKDRLKEIKSESDEIDSEIKTINKTFDFDRDYEAEIIDLKSRHGGESLVLSRLEKRREKVDKRMRMLDDLAIEHNALGFHISNGDDIKKLIGVEKKNASKLRKDAAALEKKRDRCASNVRSRVGPPLSKKSFDEIIEKLGESRNKIYAEKHKTDALIAQKKEVIEILKKAARDTSVCCPVCESDLDNPQIALKNREEEVILLEEKLQYIIPKTPLSEVSMSYRLAFFGL